MKNKMPYATKENISDRKNWSGLLWCWLPVAVWLILIFFLSSLTLKIQAPKLFSFQDKVFHFLEFGMLALLLIRAVYRRSARGKMRYLICITLVVIYGGLDEFHQYFVPGRMVEWGDFAADALGAMVCGWAWLLFAQRKNALPRSTRESA